MLPFLAVPARSDASTVADTATAYLQQRVDELAVRANATDPLYFSYGHWYVGDESCSRCQMGGAVSAAVLERRIPARRMYFRNLAATTVDRIVKTQTAAGAFPARDATNTPDPINTEFVGMQLGTVYHLIHADLTRATARQWATALGNAARYLVSNGTSTWYVNGNVNLGVTLTLGLAWKATGDRALKDAYEASWNFTLYPPPERWGTAGLQFSKVPRAADWADGAGYLVEKAATIGYDPHYTQLQASIATRMWLMLGDPRALQLANVLTNQLLLRVDDIWRLDTSAGSRNTALNQTFPFITASMAAVGRCRNGLRSPDGQFVSIMDWFGRVLDLKSLYDNSSWLGYLGNDVASFALLNQAPACPTSYATLNRVARAL